LRFAHCGGINLRAIGHRLGQSVKHLRPFQHDIRARSSGPGTRIWPAIARGDQPDFSQSEVEHRPRRFANILAQLRPDEHDDRSIGRLFARRKWGFHSGNGRSGHQLGGETFIACDQSLALSP
jgi:hypothetical protein